MSTLSFGSSQLGYERRGDGPVVVLVHGGVLDGAMTWAAQAPLAARWSVVTIDRPGFGSNPPVDRVDFAVDAELITAALDRAGESWGARRVHLVGHSYGGVIALLVAAARPDAVASLTVIEPPAFELAAGVPAVDELVGTLRAHWSLAGDAEPRRFLGRFLELVGSAAELPDPLPPPLARGAAMLVVERGPWEADIALDEIARAGVRTLVVSGAHHPAFDAVCDVLERELVAERAVIAGAGHSVPRTGAAFNQRLERFLAGTS